MNRLRSLAGRRFFRAGAALFVLSILTIGMIGTSDAGAAGPPGLQRKLNADVVGTVSITGGSCGGIVEATSTATLSGSPALGQATLVMDICVTSVTPNDVFFGTFVISTRLGTLSGDASISSPDPPGADPQNITGTLVPTSGSGPLGRATGTLQLVLQSHGAYPAPVDGTITAP